MTNKPLRIVITSGDVDGIGSEIVSKSLAKMGPKRGVHFILWRSPKCPKKHLNLIESKFKRIEVKTWADAIQQSHSSFREIIDINSNLSPADWIEISAKASVFGHVDGMATAPLSKTEILKAGKKDIGHTDILRRITGSKELYMAFLGKKFNVLLATGHIPIKSVSRQLTTDRVEKALTAANFLLKHLPEKVSNRPIGLVGLNPHAGEVGIIGTEEQMFFSQAISRAKKKGIRIEGPLIPDFAFFEENWRKYSVYVTPYHDQGLIPFKMIHGRESGVHITIGLPFIRTSVDHGTAKNIFGKNRADATSMQEAIAWAIRLCRNKSGQGTKF